ncbi:hypothetical protein PGT21_004889 [Puccinia graminis f. sp. tritici]|uniref:Clr5 domain-containing protein n=1 Tax=Puccinia graminis f. sp. tritici TaxID=56615 RepID=A0A5B0PTD0_PUCGR|nr:hypothetical protein PGTUg99_022457 [Puccinia graminis f. sp. tritici]KAA1103932.1 hypothetical protein PGT21_004889 [Puccinia graminis f. sp. tritici]
MGDILTSDYSTEFTGSDDTDNDEPTSSQNPQPIAMEQVIVRYLLSQGYQGPQILTILEERHGIKMSIRTLNRKRKLWGLQQRDLPRGPPPIIQASIRSSHSKGLQMKEIQARLYKETELDVSIRTIQRYLQQLNLRQQKNDLQDGKVSWEKVIECINHARTELLQTSAGYRSMHRILKRFYSISIPR